MTRLVAAVLVLAAVAVAPAAGGEAQEPKRGGTLVTPRPELTCLNPFACEIPAVDPALTPVLEGAFEVGPDLVYRPSLIREYTIGRTPFTITYHIRTEARWSDGAPVIAADFAFTHTKFATLRTPALDLREEYGRVRGTKVVDAKTFRIELRAPFSGWRDLYPIVLPRHALAGQDLTKVWIDRIDNPRTGRPIGSGPFLIERLERGRQLTMIRNPRYWGPHTAYIDRTVLPFLDLSDPSALGPIRRNEIDVSFGTETVPAQEVRRLPGWRVVSWPAPRQEHFAFRVGEGGHPALRSKLVRQALAFGIDRVAIARAILSEADSRSRRPLDSTVFYPGEPFYRPNWSRYRYEPGRARRLLEQAGYRRGSEGIYSCAGQPLSLRFVSLAGFPDRDRAMRLAQAQLGNVGVEVELVFAPPPVVFGQIVPSGGFDAVLFAWVNNAGGAFWPEAECGASNNATGFCSRLIMRDIQQTDFIVDPQQRARVLNAADAKLARAVPVLPMSQTVVRAAIRDGVRGIVPGGTQFNFFQNTEDWWLAE